jgi:hypothetical protein
MARHPNERDRDPWGRFLPEEEERRGSWRSRGSWERERDPRSRFMDEDEERGGGGYGREQRWQRDERPRFMDEGDYDRPRWGGPTSQRFEDDDDRYYRARFRYEPERGERERYERSRDERGRDERRRYMSEEEDRRWPSYAEREREYGDDYDRWERSPGGYGSMRGEDERERSMSRFERERDERGRFMSEDDDRGGRRGGESRGGGQGGWFGEPRRHSEAARRGWRNR